MTIQDRNFADQYRPLVSLVVPVYNEEANIPTLLDRLGALTAELEADYRFEFVFTDNCSTDRTFELLAERAADDKRIRVFRFSRNFGFQRSILTGFYKTRGDAAIQLDADLQDPPELIPDMLAKWREGYDVVYGIRRSRKEGFLVSSGRRLFYWLIDRISESEIPKNAGDFRLISKRVVDVLRGMRGSVPYIRGTIAEIGFPQIGIPYDRAERVAGTSKFRLFKLIGFAIDGIIHQSTLPLKLSAFVGVIVGLCGMGALGFYLWQYASSNQGWPAGYATLITLVVFTMVMNALFFAIIGAYLGRVHTAMKGFPVSIVDRVIDAPEIEDAPLEKTDAGRGGSRAI